jgi:hypothetical protein
MQLKLLRYLCIFSIIPLLECCNVRDANNIEGPVTYNPVFSFPVGTYNLNSKELFSKMNLNKINTVSETDTALIWYENSFYCDKNGYYDTHIFSDFNFRFLDNQQEIIKSIMFRVNSLSELPCKSTLQIYFINFGIHALDSLFLVEPLTLVPADTNTDGFVDFAYPVQNDILFDKEKIAMLQQVTRLGWHLRIWTKRSDKEYYKFLDRYKVYFQTGIRVEIETDV